MPLIVLIEDDAANRMLVASVLKKEGHQVLSADNGLDGLALVRLHRPDLVISDVQMPQMDGLAVLASLRQEPRISATPVILLTFLDERSDMRMAMVAGADDYITKPFRPKELMEAVDAQLNRRKMQSSLQRMAVDAAVQEALSEQTDHLMALYEKRLANELSERWPTAVASSGDEVLSNATVLFVDIHNYAALAEKMASEELRSMVKSFYTNASDTVHLFGAHYMQFVGEGLMVIFTDNADTHSVTHGLRACRAAVGLVDAARRVQNFMSNQYPSRALPSFGVGVALHTGPVSLVRLQDPLHGTDLPPLPVGDAVSATLLLQKQARTLGWKIAASLTMLRGVTGAVKTGGRAMVSLPGRSAPMDAVELLGLAL